MKRNNRFLVIGQLSFIVAFLGLLMNEYYLKGSSILAFISGLLFGTSLVFNITYLLKSKLR